MPVPPLTLTTVRSDTTSPAWQSPWYQQHVPIWAMMRDVHEGTRAIRAKAAQYAPRYALEHEKSWEVRVGRTEAFPAVRRTVRGLAGMAYRRNPQLAESIPAAFRADWEDIDGAGTHGDVFSRAVFQDALLMGTAGILVDAPRVEPTVRRRTLGDERRLKLRPYWCHVRAESILGQRWATVGGRPVRTQLVLEETATVPDGAFGDTALLRFRVFRRTPEAVTAEVWEQRANESAPALVQSPVVMANQVEIPFVELRLADWPPLEEMAYSMLAHFNVRADRRASMRKAIPILVRIGHDSPADPIVASTDEGVDISTNGDLKWVEHEGRALPEMRTELQDIASEMAAQGLAMLQRETRSAETAEAHRLDKAEQDSQLAQAARANRDALEQALQYHERYRQGEAARGAITVNMDFEGLTLDPQLLSEYRALVTEGRISQDTLWQILVERGALPDDFDPDAERTRLQRAAVEDLDHQVRVAGALADVHAATDRDEEGAA